MKYLRYAVAAGGLFSFTLLTQCNSPKPTASITLETPRKGYWFLSEKFPYQFMRLELYDKHVEGLPSLTMEFRIKAESAGATWKEHDSQVEINYLRPEKGTVTITPIADRSRYTGRYRSDKLDLPMIEVKLGRTVKILHYTESEEQMDKLLRAKNKLRLDVVWGPTQPEVYDAMFAFTRPTSKDIMFDLGCGDARILTAAARRFGTTGIGYDLDPKLIERGLAAAKQQNVGRLITLKTENLFAADLSSATIIAIYLSDRINQKLKPKFFRELRPGTRVVSHNWHMGDWQYDGRKFVLDNSRVVYFWIMPANFSGEWLSADGKTRLAIRQQYQLADIQGQRGASPVKLEGQRIAGNTLKLLGHTLEIEGDNAVLRWSPNEPPVTLHRTPGTIEPFSL